MVLPAVSGKIAANDLTIGALQHSACCPGPGAAVS